MLQKDGGFGVAQLHQRRPEVFSRQVALVLDLFDSQNVSLVEEAHDTSLEAVHNNLIVLVEVSELNLHAAMVVQPVDLSVGELALVEMVE